MNLKPVYSVNTQAIFTPPTIKDLEELATEAELSGCWVRRRFDSTAPVLLVAGSLIAVEDLTLRFPQYVMSCLSRCEPEFCTPEACNYLPPAPTKVQTMINASGMPL